MVATTVGTLYMIELSPSVRAVLLAGRALGIDFKLKRLNLFNGEHKTEEFKKINPLATVPTFVDNDETVIVDSHAIMEYLVEKYGKDDALYPKELAARMLVKQRLYLDCGNLSHVHQKFYFDMWTKMATEPTAKDVKRAGEAYALVDRLLEERAWIAGDALTIADFSVVATLSTLALKAPIDPALKNVTAWMQRCAELPYYQPANGRYVAIYEQILDDLCTHKGEIKIELLPELS